MQESRVCRVSTVIEPLHFWTFILAFTNISNNFLISICVGSITQDSIEYDFQHYLIVLEVLFSYVLRTDKPELAITVQSWMRYNSTTPYACSTNQWISCQVLLCIVQSLFSLSLSQLVCHSSIQVVGLHLSLVCRFKFIGFHSKARSCKVHCNYILVGSSTCSNLKRTSYCD